MEEEFQEDYDHGHQTIQANGKNLDFRYFTVTPNLNKAKIVSRPVRKSLAKKHKVVIKDKNELANKNIILKQTMKLNRKKDTEDGKDKESNALNTTPKKITKPKQDDKVRKITEFFQTLNKKAFKRYEDEPDSQFNKPKLHLNPESSSEKEDNAGTVEILSDGSRKNDHGREGVHLTPETINRTEDVVNIESDPTSLKRKASK
jgi:uncharacterized protein YrzB (UPF0473 family)